MDLSFCRADPERAFLPAEDRTTRAERDRALYEELTPDPRLWVTAACILRRDGSLPDDPCYRATQPTGDDALYDAASWLCQHQEQTSLARQTEVEAQSLRLPLGQCDGVIMKQYIATTPVAKRAIKRAHRPSSAARKRLLAAVCNCSRSRCLKLYCECFKVGVRCGAGCKCTNCQNVQGIPGAPKLKKNATVKKGCTCTQSKCAKNYCMCFGAQRACSELCRCKGCDNPHGCRGQV